MKKPIVPTRYIVFACRSKNIFHILSVALHVAVIKISSDNIEDWKLDWTGSFKKIIMTAGASEGENVEAAEMGRGNRPVFFELFKITFCSSCSFYGSVGLINARGKKGNAPGSLIFHEGGPDCAEYCGRVGLDWAQRNASISV